MVKSPTENFRFIASSFERLSAGPTVVFTLPLTQVGPARLAHSKSAQPGYTPVAWGGGSKCAALALVHAISHMKPLPLRLILPADGEGKCAVQHKVSVSQ